jgi:hypothetical protein
VAEAPVPEDTIAVLLDRIEFLQWKCAKLEQQADESEREITRINTWIRTQHFGDK